MDEIRGDGLTCMYTCETVSAKVIRVVFLTTLLPI